MFTKPAKCVHCEYIDIDEHLDPCSHCLKNDFSEFKDVQNYKSNDIVNHPKHYISHPSGIECIVIAEHHNFNIGNAFKYLWRLGLKDGNDDITDLKKAIWYLQRELQRREVAKND